jgi:nicotinamide mononucleotide transporter
MNQGAVQKPHDPWNETAVFALLTGAVATVALVMVGLGRASALEAVSFVSGAICVWLTVKENIWNFPIGLLNTATFSVVFFEARLFGDAWLQVVYFILGLIGWYLWLHGGDRRTPLHVTCATGRERTAVGLAVAASTLLLWRTLHLLGGSASFWDALTTSVSLGAQWLLNRKRIESWHLWLLVDAIYVPLYVSRGLYLTAILYAVFLVMAFFGLAHWQESARRGLKEQPASGRAVLAS